MKKLNNQYPIFSLITLFGMALPILSCPINIYNDRAQKDDILIFDKNAGNIVRVPTGKIGTIGHGQMHAQFKLFVKSETAENTFRCYASIDQIECDDINKNPQLNFTTIENGYGKNIELFSITRELEDSDQKPSCGCGKS